MSKPPLVVHLLYRLDMGGLEMLLVECINRMPAERYRHAVVCLTETTPFARRIERPGVAVYALHKAPGWSLGTQYIFWKLMRRLQPALLHTYNLAAIEYHPGAALAGVRGRVHAEHGRSADDPQGRNRRHNLLRRLVAPWIHAFVPVSQELRLWLAAVVGVAPAKTTLVANGVDTERFRPDGASHAYFGPDCFVIGTVGRMQAVKNHRGLVEAFIRLRARLPDRLDRLRLVIVGAGEEQAALRSQIALAGLEGAVCLPGACADIAAILRGFSVFALSSVAEGTPISVLEAMASGLAVVATSVGGLPELVQDGRTGTLVAPDDSEAMAAALERYCLAPELAARHGLAGSIVAGQRHSIDATVANYLRLYDRVLAPRASPKSGRPTCAE